MGSSSPPRTRALPSPAPYNQQARRVPPESLRRVGNLPPHPSLSGLSCAPGATLTFGGQASFLAPYWADRLRTASNGEGQAVQSPPNSFDGFRAKRHIKGRGRKMNRQGPWIQPPSTSRSDGEDTCLLRRAKRTMQPLSRLSPVPKQLWALIGWGFWPLC
uniref:uncharacterized protein LOC143312686 n=1 Tax=Arvicanthis niloticus TaxID=61156 RepID=UPI00402B90D1